ncbi:hypothetical protein Tco_0631918 [Tanacetum coccineum]
MAHDRWLSVVRWWLIRGSKNENQESDWYKESVISKEADFKVVEGLEDDVSNVEFMVDWCEEDEDDDKSGEGEGVLALESPSAISSSSSSSLYEKKMLSKVRKKKKWSE